MMVAILGESSATVGNRLSPEDYFELWRARVWGPRVGLQPEPPVLRGLDRRPLWILSWFHKISILLVGVTRGDR